MGLVYAGMTAVIYGLFWKRQGYRPDLMDLWPAALLAFLPSMLIWALFIR